MSPELTLYQSCVWHLMTWGTLVWYSELLLSPSTNGCEQSSFEQSDLSSFGQLRFTLCWGLTCISISMSCIYRGFNTVVLMFLLVLSRFDIFENLKWKYMWCRSWKGCHGSGIRIRRVSISLLVKLNGHIVVAAAMTQMFFMDKGGCESRGFNIRMFVKIVRLS